MRLLDTAIDPRTQSYLDARASMLVALAELEAALELAREGGGERAVTRHHARGKLLARERIELLVDRDSPLLELSPATGWSTSDPVGGGVVTAIGVVEDLTCMIIASDPTVRSGMLTTAALRKISRAQEIAYENRLPVISLIETNGYEQAEHAEILMLTGRVVTGYARLAAAGIPTAGAFFGSTVLGEVDLASSFDYLVAIPQAGGFQAADHLAEDDRDALRLTRQCVLRFHAPAGLRGGMAGGAAPPWYDPEDLLATPPGEPREILARILDASEFDELRPGHGPSLCAGWGSLHGHRVAILAGAAYGPRSGIGSGVLTGAGGAGAEEAGKAARLIRQAETSRTPLLLLRHGDAMATAVPAGAAVPVVTVRIGGWQGLSPVDARARFRFAWPNAYAGSGVSALQLSGRLDDDGVIDPRDTRTVLGICLSVIVHSLGAGPERPLAGVGSLPASTGSLTAGTGSLAARLGNRS